MHIVTFYSYNGGVGRTMALVNAAAVLAQRGRKVLIVDFDLEAPGISTYAPFAGLADAKGVVEYVSEYMATSTAPCAEEFIVQSTLGNASIWVMPAGKRNREYASRLVSIDWQSLYSRQSGFLFFEDLKLQWKSLKFDYVLIDSRTGHTDVGGICTRHLPNSVVVMFFPNDQNLIGLESVVRDIREEQRGPRRANISLLFCASNVPDLDDEDHILERKLDEAKKILGYRDAPSIVRHYNSLTLLEQSLFVLDRPESRLAAEYKSLVDKIVSQNFEDIDGAIAELRKMRDGLRQRPPADEEYESISVKLAEIEKLHPANGRIAWLMAQIFSFLGDLDAESRSLTTAIEAGVNVQTARRRRAAIARLESRSDDALIDLRAILAGENSSPYDVVAAVELLREFDPDWIEAVARSPALKTLEGSRLIRLAEILLSDGRGVSLVVQLMQELFQISQDARVRRQAKLHLVLALISSRQFERAMKEIASNREDVLRSENVVDVFNFAMAEWGHTGKSPYDLMQAVVLLSAGDDPNTVNRRQCLALAQYVAGNVSAAKQHIRLALELNEHVRGREFSCWRYLEVSRKDMRSDLIALNRYVSGEGPGPSVLAETEESPDLFRN
ncbi:MinD/ParA family protein [Bradyrhizobium sp. STM 3557]|uniref:MinD/ParA family ATP-binding protein n=1 Tax=Bradyrhizobium sp. STM 3557 TaxID=578920 RepID=UPI00388F2132